MTVEELSQHNDYFFEKATLITKDAEIAGDLVQEMYLRLLKLPDKKVQSFKSLKYGAIRIMNQIWIDQKRKEREHFISINDCNLTEDETTNHRAEYRSLIGQLLWKIPKNERYIFYLYTVDNLTIKQLNQSTGISKRTIEYSLCKAKKIAGEVARRDQKINQLVKDLGIL